MISATQIDRWLQEDIGHHDVTNSVDGSTSGRLIATEGGVAAGVDAAASVFRHLGVAVDQHVEDGERIESGAVVLRTEGPARETLRAERLAVNLAGHAAGIATKTREAVEEASAVSERVTIAGTRKTTPGLRGIEKRAVVAGGGDSHRLDSSQMVMVKENHIAALGLETAVDRFREQASFATKIEVEAESTEQALRAAGCGVDIVLLDNMSPAETEAAVDALADQEATVLTEASGGITVGDVSAYAATGVDIISMGSLTHSAPSLDFSFRTE